MVSKLIPDPNVEVCSVWPRNPTGHNEDIVSAWRGGGGGGGGGGGEGGGCVCHILYQIWEKLSRTI